MTAEELGLSPEAVDFVHAIIARGRNGPAFERDVVVARARLRVADGIADEEDLRIAQEFEGKLLPHQW